MSIEQWLFGDVAAVWTPAAFITAIGFGFAFGYLVLASIAAQERWSTNNSDRAIAWLAGVLTAWFLALLSASQLVAAFIDGDTNWVRILSRLGPQLACAAAVGFGTWRGLVRARNIR